MNAHAERCFPARQDCLSSALDFVEAWSLQQGVSPADALRLRLVVEELFSNTLTHGHGGDAAAQVQLRLAIDVRHIQLDYRDEAPAFDPLSRAVDPLDAPAGATSRPLGGFGLAIIRDIAHSASYAREAEHNLLQMLLARSDQD